MAESKTFAELKSEAERKVKIREEVISHSDFMKKELPPNKWVCDSLIPEGMTILSSAPGQFKTYILLALSKQVSTGESGFGHFHAEQRNVLFVNEEMGEKSMQDRLKTLDGSADNLFFTNLSGIKLEDMTIILEICKEKKISLVIFDSLTRIHNLAENDASDVKKIFEAMLILLRENISVIMSHHHRKAPIFGGKHNGSDEMRGSTDFLAMTDCHLAIDNISKDKAFLVIRQLKLRQAENIPDFKVNIEKKDNFISFVYRGKYSPEDERNVKVEDGKEIVLQIISENPGITREKILEKTGGKIGIVIINTILPNLEKKGIILSEAKKPKMYFIKEEIETLFG